MMIICNDDGTIDMVSMIAKKMMYWIVITIVLKCKVLTMVKKTISKMGMIMVLSLKIKMVLILEITIVSMLVIKMVLMIRK